MEPFVFRRGQGEWPSRATLLHVYAIPDLERHHELAALVTGCRTATEGFPLAHVGDPWMHITLSQIADRPAAQIPQDERDKLAAALQLRLAEVSPLQVLIGSPLSYHSGVICDIYPDAALGELCGAVRDVIKECRGPDAAVSDIGVPHLTLSYATAEASSDDAQRRLRRVRPGHAPLNIDTVHLVDVRADAERKTITWNHVAGITLGGEPLPQAAG